MRSARSFSIAAAASRRPTTSHCILAAAGQGGDPLRTVERLERLLEKQSEARLFRLERRDPRDLHGAHQHRLALEQLGQLAG